MATKLVLAIGLVSLLAASGCATKKFVKNRVNPVSQRVEGLESASTEHKKDIGELQTQVSRVEEDVLSADQKAAKAGAAAEQARMKADEAGEQATAAQQMADRANSGLNALDNRVNQLNNYELASSENILFGFESSKLTKEEQEKLDTLSAGLTDGGSYVIEVRGFTDKSGNAAYNLDLSKKRAEAVVRYLTMESNIPLHRIHTIGLGSDNPASDNATREGRKLNRRVELRVFVADQPAMTTARTQ